VLPTVENSSIYSILRMSLPPIYSQYNLSFPRYGKQGFSDQGVDKAVDDLCRFYPQHEKAWKGKQTIHPE